MREEITLTYYDGAGRAGRADVATRRFTIGRLLENDLAIEDPRVSLRHAVVERLDDATVISDCGSEHGTLVNGEPVAGGGTKLHDGDVITLGGDYDLTVELRGTSTGELTGAKAESAPVNSPHTHTHTRIIAATAAALLVLCAAVLLLVSSRRDGANAVAARDSVSAEAARGDDATAARMSTASDATQASAADVASASEQAGELEEVEKYALRVMREISNDQTPTLARPVVSQIRDKVRDYRGSASLLANLRAFERRDLSGLAGEAKRRDIKLPLVVFAALARMERDGDGSSDPVEVASKMLPALSNLRAIFGTELANDSLLVVAGYDSWRGGATHPLQTAVFELAKRQPESPAAIRNVWYLHEHERLSRRSYDFVLSFLAVGVVAQAPQKFGLEVAPLVF